MPILGDETGAVALGDIDGDGDLDLFLGTNDDPYSGARNRLYVNDGTGIFSDETTPRLPDSSGTGAVAIGDVDADGDADLILANGGGAWNQLFLNDGSGTFTDATTARLPTSWNWTTAVALADLDADGDQDLVFANRNYGQNQLFLNDGSGTFTDVTAAQMPVAFDDTSGMALGNVDLDGDLDLVFVNTNYRPSTLYLNDGNGTFTDATATRLPSGRGNFVALDDVDGDGDSDLVLSGTVISYPGSPL